MDELITTIQQQVLKGEHLTIGETIGSAMEKDLLASEILNNGLIAAMDEVGRRFEAGEFFVPEMLISARAMKAGLAALRPSLGQEGVKTRGKAVIGTVRGDLHDIGKNLVGIMLEGAGFEVIDLGSDIPPERFAQVVREEQADILGLSALLTTTMEQMGLVIEAVEDIGMRAKVHILVGGAPLTDSYAKEIGADGYAPDASSAITLARQLLSGAS
jgi:5-methyltetrahydrofolate--homocysteine methyltransferase